MHDDLLIRVLGPIDVATPTGAVAVGGPKAQAVLGTLAIGAGRAVSIDQLNEALWGADVPDSAPNTLQSYISQLRRILGSNAIVRSDHSYELDVSHAGIDAVQFEGLLADAVESSEDPDTCGAGCREALAMWRGRPFGDLADDEPFRLETYRLDELRLAAMECSLEADLRRGHHELIIGELESAVEEHPYRERLWYMLIRALGGTDRRVEALRVAARLRDVLAEVGVEGADELVELEQQILDPAPFPPP